MKFLVKICWYTSGSTNMSHEKRAHGWLGYIGDEILPSYIGDYFTNNDIRIPINQPGFNGK